MAEIRGLRKVLITPEWNKIERWALRRSKGTLFLPDGQLKSKIKCKNAWEVLLMKMVFKNSPSWSTATPIRFNMVLYSVLPSLKWWKPQVSSSFHCRFIQKNTHPPFFLKRAIQQLETWFFQKWMAIHRPIIQQKNYQNWLNRTRVMSIFLFKIQRYNGSALHSHMNKTFLISWLKIQ